MSDRVLGVALLAASTAGFVYYSVWTLALPFVDADQPLHRLFPPRHWAVALPAYAIAVVVSLVAAYAAKVMLLPERRKQARKRSADLLGAGLTARTICAGMRPHTR